MGEPSPDDQPVSARPASPSPGGSSARRRSTSACSAGQLAKPYSRATANWAADRDTRSEKARTRASAAGSPSAAARSSSRAWRRSWSMSGRPGSSDMTSPHSPGSHVGSVRRRSCRKALPRNRGGLRSCPRTRRRPLTPTRKAYSARAGPSSSPDLDEPDTARRSGPDLRDRTCLPSWSPCHRWPTLRGLACPACPGRRRGDDQASASARRQPRPGGGVLPGVRGPRAQHRPRCE